MNTPITQIDHIGAPVRDANRTVSFFESIGLPVAFEETLEEHNVHVIFIDIDGIYLELLEPRGPGEMESYLENHGPGYHHVAYRVPDIDSAVDMLRGKGIAFQSETPMRGANETRIIFLDERSTGGYQIELVEHS